jgi:two-component system, LytTR family, sensor kinase
MITPNLKLMTILQHTLWWLGYISIINLFIYIDKPSFIFFIRLFITYPLIISVFYINAHFIIEKYWSKGLYIQHIIFSLLLFSGYAFCRFLLMKFFFHDYDKYSETLFFTRFSLDTAWIALQFFLYSYAYWFGLRGIRLERDKRILHSQVMQLEKSQIETELRFLQAQINPHFLFNTFNFLYSEAIKSSPKMADSVMALTSMMRHITDLSHDKLISLDKEIEYLYNYIKIQQYRFDTQLNLIFEVENQDLARFHKVPPLVFISIVENCFKYGDFSEAEFPVTITFSLTENQVHFKTFNLKRAYVSTSKSSGIGMNNIMTQLNHIYGQHHSLKILDNSNNYSVELSIFNTYLANNNE